MTSPAGVPCWTDLMVDDLATVQPFYSAVLGWSFTEPDDAHGGYVMALADGQPVAGMGTLRPGSRTAWTMYIASDDADAAAAAVAEAGGWCWRPMDVSDLGRMFVAQIRRAPCSGSGKPGPSPAVRPTPPGLVGRTCGPRPRCGARVLRCRLRLHVRTDGDGRAGLHHLCGR